MHSHDTPNPTPDQHFHEDDLVLVWYPLHGADEGNRDTWSWLPGAILAQCGPDEWHVLIEVPNLAEPDPTVPNGDAPENLLYPACYRDASELRAVSVRDWDHAYRVCADA